MFKVIMFMVGFFGLIIYLRMEKEAQTAAELAVRRKDEQN